MFVFVLVSLSVLGLNIWVSATLKKKVFQASFSDSLWWSFGLISASSRIESKSVTLKKNLNFFFDFSLFLNNVFKICDTNIKFFLVLIQSDLNSLQQTDIFLFFWTKFKSALYWNKPWNYSFLWSTRMKEKIFEFLWSQWFLNKIFSFKSDTLRRLRSTGFCLEISINNSEKKMFVVLRRIFSWLKNNNSTFGEINEIWTVYSDLQSDLLVYRSLIDLSYLKFYPLRVKLSASVQFTFTNLKHSRNKVQT